LIRKGAAPTTMTSNSMELRFTRAYAPVSCPDNQTPNGIKKVT
jgi:hypothetical protein